MASKCTQYLAFPNKFIGNVSPFYYILYILSDYYVILFLQQMPFRLKHIVFYYKW